MTLFFSAKEDKKFPCFEINDLFAVMKCFLFFNVDIAIFLAKPSDPPINSMTILIDGFEFVNGSISIKEGDTVALIEAMKTFNAVKAPKSGIIKEILISNAQPVEYGERLFVIE